LTYVNAGLRVVVQALTEENAASGVLRGVVRFDVEEVLDAVADALAPRDAVQIRSSVECLLVDPGPSAGRILVFEPAIRVSDRDTVEDLRHRLHG